jgi:ribonuclease BN (tRNA processing enzyme)
MLPVVNLEENMTIQLQMAGTGSAFAKAFFNNNALIHSGDFKLMIDFGQTAPMALHKLQIPLNQLNAVLITHLHADHIFGLEELAFQSMYRYGHKNGKIKLYLAEVLVDQLWEHSLKGGLLNTKDGINTLDHYFDVQPIQAGVPYTLHEGLTIEIIQTDHVPQKLNYSVFINDSIFYTADMTFNRAILEYALYERQCHTILHDCQLQGMGMVHAALAELLTLPSDMQSHIYLMHYDDNMPDFIGKTGQMRFIEQHKIYDL